MDLTEDHFFCICRTVETYSQHTCESHAQTLQSGLQQGRLMCYQRQYIYTTTIYRPIYVFLMLNLNNDYQAIRKQQSEGKLKH